jgi:hypothetical protein
MIPLVTAAALIAAPLLAQDQPSAAPHTYAVLVGSNQAGPGQQALQWAVRDAQRMEQVLVELGGFDPERVQLIEDPSPAALLGVLDQHAAMLGAHAAADEDAVFVFYYSGHAKAQGLELGAAELSLGALEAKLEAMPAALTLVVLDACQAGAISGVKGATPAADFSHNASEGLSTRGLAVLASSTGTELSQESAELEGGYFTHHLITALRGAADDNGDGRVTLDEAYEYAYHHTLVSTAATAVGRQHVTLETRIHGHGETVLTRPSQAEAFLRLPAEMAGELLIYRAEDRLVSAELHKAAGSQLKVGLLPGDYQALLRRDGDLYRCELSLDPGDTTFYPDRCEYVPPPPDVEIKGSLVRERHEHLMIELSVAGGRRHDSEYTDRLEEFGFDWPTGGRLLEPQLSVAWTPRPFVGAVFSVGNLDYDGWERRPEDQASTVHGIEWETWRARAAARGSLPLLHGWLTPYLQAGGGPALGLTRYTDEGDGSVEKDRFWGWHWSGAVGLQFMPTHKNFRHVGVYHEFEYSSAPVIHNLLGDVHDNGGLAISMGLRAGF